MILKRYGKRVESVTTSFRAVAFVSIGWERDRVVSLTDDEFQARYERVVEHTLTADAEGPVQLEVETALLADLDGQVETLHESLAPGQVLFVENQRGVDEPRTHERRLDVLVDGENRYYFHWSIDPPLRLSVYVKRV